MLDRLILACPTCASNFKQDGDAAGWSIFFLLIVILCILGGIAFCMVRLAKREAQALDPELMDDPIPKSLGSQSH